MGPSPLLATTNPTAFAIFALRQSGTLISEASVPATVPLQSGFFFADVSGSINTGVAIANMNSDNVDIQYQLTDAGGGTVTQSGIITVAARTQFARFLNELPFGLHLPVQGTFSFTASEPISVIALRGRLAWAHDWISDPNVMPTFQALPGASFIVQGATPAKSSALTSAGAELRLMNGVSLLGKFDGEFAAHAQTYAGTGTLPAASPGKSSPSKVRSCSRWFRQEFARDRRRRLRYRNGRA